MQQAIIRAQQVSKEFIQGGVTIAVLNALDCKVMQGQTYAFTGVSGAGKSTLLHIMAGLDDPTSGAVFLDEKSFSTLTSAQRSYMFNQLFGFVFQTSYLISELSVLENVMMPGLIAGMSVDACKERAHNMLSIVGLADKASTNPLTLSGGQQQRVVIIRALYNKPKFVFADEPTGNLDEKTGLEVIEFLLECQREWKMGLVISTHDAYVADRMETQFVLHNGKLTVRV